MVERIA
jgi:hypothetical protein